MLYYVYTCIMCVYTVASLGPMTRGRAVAGTPAVNVRCVGGVGCSRHAITNCQGFMPCQCSLAQTSTISPHLMDVADLVGNLLHTNTIHYFVAKDSSMWEPPLQCGRWHCPVSVCVNAYLQYVKEAYELCNR